MEESVSENAVKSKVSEREIKANKNTAIVVGGSSGIGLEVVTKLVNRGWNVINVSRTACPNIKVKNVAADVTAGNTLREAITVAAQRYGLHTLVYCAGFSMAAPIEHATESDIKYLFDVNYFGAVKAVQAAIPFLKNKGGRIILIGSVGGDIPIAFDAFYSASKAALEMFARSAYMELKHYGIKVSALLPGGTATNFTYKRKIYSDEENKGYHKNVNRAVAALANMEQSGMSPSAVAEDIYKLVLADNPPVVKVSGFKNNALYYMERLLPGKFTLYFADKVYHQ